ncbi:MAG: putative undecaprenyl-phosphate N-acetylglucosaminyl 1-phosphate transferase [Alphaproteobacteria bacterium MarineAlpha2_Bin1]|nr:MAG: putative undecaprenyl-phosphate N-acetylglucosaminyl 1-phosphate transferase [Alphaproteobacteria bacterium MarineAlpha2_Bin1]
MFWYIGVTSLLAFLLSFFGCKLAINIFSKKKIFDEPNLRSSHSKATPIGAGIVIIFIILLYIFLYTLFKFLIYNDFNVSNLFIFIIVFTLAYISWKDDLNRVSRIFRIFFHILAATIGINCLSDPGLVFQGILPTSLDILLTIILWVWIINLTNFMDGIDGITGAGSIFTFFGSLIIFLIIGQSLEFSNNSFITTFLLIITFSLLGFLFWNWYPAKIFLGDVGSIPIGFLIGWIIFELAIIELWHVSFLLPMYYFFDSTLTLLNRIIRKEKIFDPHRNHFYQKISQIYKHSRVVIYISLLNTSLVILSILGTLNNQIKDIVILIGVILTSLMILIFQIASKRYK